MAREVKKRKTTAKRTYKKAEKRVERKINPDVMAVIIIFAGIFVGVSMFTDITGVVGEYLKLFLMGMFGVPAYILCFAMIACSIHYLAKKQFGRYVRKYIFVTIFVVFLCAFQRKRWAVWLE